MRLLAAVCFRCFCQGNLAGVDWSRGFAGNPTATDNFHWHSSTIWANVVSTWFQYDPFWQQSMDFQSNVTVEEDKLGASKRDCFALSASLVKQPSDRTPKP